MAQRKLRSAAAAFMLASGVLGVGTAQAEDNAAQLCKNAPETGISQGACVSLARAGNPTALISGLCKLEGAPEAVGTTNHGQCMKALRAAAGLGG